jgi:hypothetical protein
MPNDEAPPSEPWYRSSPRNLVFFVVIWLGESFLILLLFKWLLRASAKIYFLVIPWALFGAVMVFRPNWINRLTQTLELNSKRIDKWNPPGFP